jgi:hypothetical protein
MRFLLFLIIVLLAAVAWWPDQPVPTAEESFISPQIQSLNNVRNFEQEYLEGLDKKKEQMDKQADGG